MTGKEIGLLLVINRRLGCLGAFVTASGIPWTSLNRIANQGYMLHKKCTLDSGDTLRGWEQVRDHIEETLTANGASPEEVSVAWKPYAEARQILLGDEENIKDLRPDLSKDKIYHILNGGTMLNAQALKHFHLDSDPFHLYDFDMVDDFWPFPLYMETVKRITDFADRGGCLLVYGPVGSGKTTILERATVEIERRQIKVIQPESRKTQKLSPGNIEGAILQAISANYGYSGSRKTPRGGEAQGFDVRAAMEILVNANQRAVLIIDEVQDLTDETLRYLKRIWEKRVRIGTKKRHVLGVILVGQEDISRKIKGKSVLELHVRIDEHKINHIPELQVNEYLKFKLKRAGGSWDKICGQDLQEELAFGIHESLRTPQNLNDLAAKLMNYATQIPAGQMTLEFYWQFLEYKGAGFADVKVCRQNNRKRNQSETDNINTKAG